MLPHPRVQLRQLGTAHLRVLQHRRPAGGGPSDLQRSQSDGVPGLRRGGVECPRGLSLCRVA
ncbi:hypothetical protein [Ornithinimicrobium kibberense]|uniref:hypothetical protein n=1 Tax=Ornithinimicrobium kibberense TaxID=282060 RepID=UPI00360A3C53